VNGSFVCSGYCNSLAGLVLNYRIAGCSLAESRQGSIPSFTQLNGSIVQPSVTWLPRLLTRRADPLDSVAFLSCDGAKLRLSILTFIAPPPSTSSTPCGANCSFWISTTLVVAFYSAFFELLSSLATAMFMRKDGKSLRCQVLRLVVSRYATVFGQPRRLSPEQQQLPDASQVHVPKIDQRNL
jgi:hypothetical protein